MASVHFINVQNFGPLVAPYCGSEARFGTNPFCVAMPGSDRRGTFVLEFATSMVALGKTRVMHHAGKTFEEPVLLGPQGHPTTDPGVMWQTPRGALMAFANHKGSGLCWACELMAGLLSGGGTIEPHHQRDGSIVNNMTAIVIDPAAVGDPGWMQQEFDRMYDYVKSSPAPDPMNHPVLMPGEMERICRAKRLAEGIEVSDGELEAIQSACREAGVDEAIIEGR